MVVMNKVNFKKAKFCRLAWLHLDGSRKFDNKLAIGKAIQLNWWKTSWVLIHGLRNQIGVGLQRNQYCAGIDTTSGGGFRLLGDSF